MKSFFTAKYTKIAVGIVIVILIAAIPSLYFKKQYDDLKRNVKGTSTSVQNEVAQLTEKIGRHVLLPTSNETPTILTVTNKEQLEDQAFFANAINGDKVLIYSLAKKAFLYRPSKDLVIEVAPVNISSASAGTTAQNRVVAPTPTITPYTMVILNGTTIVGLTNKYQETIKETGEPITILDRDNAKDRGYESSILVDISGDKSDVAERLAQELNISTGSLPAGESAPKADFVIILGTDAQ